MGEEKQRRNRLRQEFLLTFFDKRPDKREREVNGFFLEKRWSGTTEKWEVAIYTRESWKRYKHYHQNKLL